MLIVQVMREHIAEIEGRAEHSVTTLDIHECTRRFGMTHDDVVAAARGIEAREASARELN
jgi:hypothetical protein